MTGLSVESAAGSGAHAAAGGVTEYTWTEYSGWNIVKPSGFDSLNPFRSRIACPLNNRQL